MSSYVNARFSNANTHNTHVPSQHVECSDTPIKTCDANNTLVRMTTGLECVPNDAVQSVSENQSYVCKYEVPFSSASQSS